MFRYWKLALLPLLLASVRAEYPVEFEDVIIRNQDDPDSYRLPEDLDPIHIDVEITPYFVSESGKEAFSFDGIVSILMKAQRAGITEITIQDNVRAILDVTLTDEAGVPVEINRTKPYERIREFHFLKVYLGEGVTLTDQSNYILTVVYIGNINETPLSRGIFRGSYKGTDGRTHWYAASHLQPVNSRQAFPCFDEPGYKSTFNIIINRPANFGPSYSNMRVIQEIPIGNRVKEIFQTTPRMSAYLVSIHISEEFKVIADNNNENESYRIIARPNAEGQGQYALDVGVPITKWLEDYFSIKYYTMEPNIKNDQIAVPDWASGATENWGLVSYRELRLLYQDGETNAVDKMSIGTITAHELAHKWFGNLITCRWWDNVWINEGFASYFEYFAMHGIDKSLELEDQFNIMYLQSALSADASMNTRALQYHVNSPAQVTGHFSGISYSKGASLLNMLKYFVTENTFKKALNYFLVDRAYEHAFPEDIYRAFGQAVTEDSTIPSHVDIQQFIKYWVDERGYPILKVEVNMESGLINLKQERFLISGSTPDTNDQVWPLPLTYTTGANPNWNDLSISNVMNAAEVYIQGTPGENWVIFNIQQKGIYRVTYDTHNWELIASALKTNVNSIHYLNRAQIVDDVFALMRSERITYNLGFKILDFLKDDTSYYSWYPAISGFNWIRNRFLHLPDALAEFDKILYSFLDTVINHIGYSSEQDNEPITRILSRFHILNFACNIGHEGCVEDAISRFINMRDNNIGVDPNLRRHVFCRGVHQGGYDDWRFLYTRHFSSNNNQASEVATLRGLGCTTNERAIAEYLDMILSDEVRAQDRLNAFNFLFMGDRGNARRSLDFVKRNIENIRRGVVLETWFQNFINNLASYMDEEGLDEMEAWLRDSQTNLPEAAIGLNAIASSRNNMRWGTEHADMILGAARGSAITILPTAIVVLTAIAALFLS